MDHAGIPALKDAIRHMHGVESKLTNASSKLTRNHRAATAPHIAHYNFVRRHQTLRVSPAMAAGVTETLWDMGQLS